MANATAEHAIALAGTPTRFRAAKAYWLAVRVLAGYLWLRLWRPVLGPSLYNAKLIDRHQRTSKRLVAAILELKGLFIKVGQLISILTNFLPPEFRAELEQLQARLARQRHQQFRGHRLGRDLLLDVGLDVLLRHAAAHSAAFDRFQLLQGDPFATRDVPYKRRIEFSAGTGAWNVTLSRWGRGRSFL